MARGRKPRLQYRCSQHQLPIAVKTVFVFLWLKNPCMKSATQGGNMTFWHALCSKMPHFLKVINSSRSSLNDNIHSSAVITGSITQPRIFVSSLCMAVASPGPACLSMDRFLWNPSAWQVLVRAPLWLSLQQTQTLDSRPKERVPEWVLEDLSLGSKMLFVFVGIIIFKHYCSSIFVLYNIDFICNA